MIPMTNHTSREPHSSKHRLMRTLTVQVLDQRMAGSTDCSDRAHLRGCGAVIAVAGGAAGGGQVPSLCQCFPMYAFPVIFKLVGGQLVFRHVRRVCVASSTRLRKTQGVDRRARILNFPDVVDAVAIDTIGC